MSSYLHPAGVRSELLGCARVHVNACLEAPAQRPLSSTGAVASCEWRGRRDGKIKDKSTAVGGVHVVGVFLVFAPFAKHPDFQGVSTE
jgi:hypothetical protein